MTIIRTGILAIAAFSSIPAALCAAPGGASAQATPEPALEAMRRSFPDEHRVLAAALAGQAPEAQQRLVSEAMQRFTAAHLQAILAAPAPRLAALVSRQAVMLRSLEGRDPQLCALLSDRGFLGSEARAASPPVDVGDYAIGLIEAAAAGAGRPRANPATREDIQAWLAAVQRREPSLPIGAMLQNREFRSSTGPVNICKSAAALFEAPADLPPDQAARVAVLLLQSVLAINDGGRSP